MLGDGQPLAVSADGTRVLVLQDHVRNQPLAVHSTGVGQVEPLPTSDFVAEIGDWTADGRRLFLLGSLEGGAVRGYVFDPQTKEFTEVPPDLPDVKSVRFHRDLGLVLARSAGGPLAIYSIEGDSVEQPGALAEIGPKWIPVGWSLDGRSIHLAEEVETGAVPVVTLDLDTGEKRPLYELHPRDSSGLIAVGPIYVNPGGDAYVYRYRRETSTLYVAEGF